MLEIVDFVLRGGTSGRELRDDELEILNYALVRVLGASGRRRRRGRVRSEKSTGGELALQLIKLVLHGLIGLHLVVEFLLARDVLLAQVVDLGHRTLEMHDLFALRLQLDLETSRLGLVLFGLLTQQAYLALIACPFIVEYRRAYKIK